MTYDDLRACALGAGIVATAALAYAVVLSCSASRLRRERDEAHRQRDVLLRELEAVAAGCAFNVVGVIPVVVPLRIPEPVREGPVPRGVLGGRL